MGLVDRIVVMDFGWKLVEGTPALVRATRAFRKPISAAWHDGPPCNRGFARRLRQGRSRARGQSRAASGQIVTVIGPNGAGKTTLLAAAAGLLRSRGKVIYDGIESCASTSKSGSSTASVWCRSGANCSATWRWPTIFCSAHIAAPQRLRSETKPAAGLRRFPRLAERRSRRRRHCRAASARCWRSAAR